MQRGSAALNYPNIFFIYHIEQQDGAQYIVTESLEGESLRERFRHGALPLRDAIDIAIQVAKGLSAAIVDLEHPTSSHRYQRGPHQTIEEIFAIVTLVKQRFYFRKPFPSPPL